MVSAAGRGVGREGQARPPVRAGRCLPAGPRNRAAREGRREGRGQYDARHLPACVVQFNHRCPAASCPVPALGPCGACPVSQQNARTRIAASSRTYGRLHLCFPEGAAAAEHQSALSLHVRDAFPISAAVDSGSNFPLVQRSGAPRKKGGPHRTEPRCSGLFHIFPRAPAIRGDWQGWGDGRGAHDGTLGQGMDTGGRNRISSVADEGNKETHDSGLGGSRVSRGVNVWAVRLSWGPWPWPETETVIPSPLCPSREGWRY